MHSETDSDDDELPQLAQFAQEVLDYSSCYGSHGTISYSALNITGRPFRYPSYGDFSECFSLRSYSKPPVVEREFSAKDVQDSVTFHDFVVIQFEHLVLPREITIFETYNPGAVVRIFAYGCGKWEVLWQAHPAIVEKKAREFKPALKKINLPTRILRIEFDTKLVDYYIGIDAVLLKGIKCSIAIDRFTFPSTQRSESRFIMGLIQQKLEKVNFSPKIAASDAMEEFLKNDLNKFIEDAGFGETKEKAISDIPDEVLYNIMTFLDLRSLFNCSQVSRKFHQISKDPLLYVEVNLKAYWHLADSSLMQSLHHRCKLIRKLDLSSCGYFNAITADNFITFLRLNGKSLTNLRLNSTQFMTSIILQTIGFKCENLVELAIRNYSNVTDNRDFMSLSLLTKLEVLDLTRSGIDSYALLTLIMNNENLTHLYLAFNNQLNVDQVCIQLATYCRNLRVLDIWKCHNLTTNGLRAISSCDQLEILDLGWNLREEGHITDTFKLLIQNCQNLRRIVLAAVRGIAERDLLNIATFCRNLEHLDLMGIVGMSSEAVLKILEQCERLKVLDVSFCENLDDQTLHRWSTEFDVSIKRSEVPSEN